LLDVLGVLLDVLGVLLDVLAVLADGGLEDREAAPGLPIEPVDLPFENDAVCLDRFDRGAVLSAHLFEEDSVALSLLLPKVLPWRGSASFLVGHDCAPVYFSETWRASPETRVITEQPGRMWQWGLRLAQYAAVTGQVGSCRSQHRAS